MDLQNYRAKLNEVDDALLSLFKERMNISKLIGTYKKEHGLPVLDVARESEKLADFADKAGEEFRPYAQKLYSTLAELSRAYQNSVTPNLKKTFGLLGEKLGHSFSQMIHRYLGDYDYFLYEVNPDNLATFMKEKRFDGVNVTIPYKRSVMAYCDVLSDEARMIGSVNTIIKGSDHSLHGYNTDYYGFGVMLEHGGINPNGKKVLVLGDGGAARTVRAVLNVLGAGEIVTISRRGENNYQNIARHHDAEIIINTTPVGMYPDNGASLLYLPPFEKLVGVADLIYNPLRTKLLLDAERLGVPCVNGLIMLVAQAEMASRLFMNASTQPELAKQSPDNYAAQPELTKQSPACGVTQPVLAKQSPDCGAAQPEITKQPPDNYATQPELTKQPPVCGAAQPVLANDVCNAVLREIRNITLIGMPGCGKTTAGRALSRMMGRPFVDIDERIEEETGRQIPDIINEDGEEAFRQLETRLLAIESRKTGLVIATGGGVVTRPENLDLLRQNSFVVYIKRNLADLESDGRPLTLKEGVHALASHRLPLYEAWSDCGVQAELEPELTAAKIMTLP